MRRITLAALALSLLLPVSALAHNLETENACRPWASMTKAS